MVRKTAKKAAKPATRKGQYKQASAQRASRKRRQTFSKHIKVILGSSAGVLACIAIGWIIYSGTAQLWLGQLRDVTYKQTANAGFALHHVYLSGHDKLSRQAVIHHSHVRKEMPILSLSLPEMRERLEALPQVRRAFLSRQLPDTLKIHLIERFPVALWKEGEKYHLVDSDGVLMGEAVASTYTHLPLFVGAKAYEQSPYLLAMLKDSPRLREDFDSAVYIGKRRWNIWLHSGIEIKLPERKPLDALAQLEALHNAEPLRGSDINSIDLRVPERMFIQPKVKLLQKASHQL